ncbi:MAG: NAD(P)/FAD-dependent oxidoreductase, partial [Gammaproteobacteria bacterium]|nr:NAD(P)/FAD-dependent oxidoreductase [Gammaproteobacteria bacterium]
EIQAYLEQCATTYNIRPHLRFGTTVTSIRFVTETNKWEVSTANQGQCFADIVISATGPLSQPKTPAIAGLENFGGTVFHSAKWRHDHPLAGQQIAVIGTGASAIQFVPRIATQARRLFVYQRSAPWLLPRRDRRFSPTERKRLRQRKWLTWAKRQYIYFTQELLAFGFLGRGAVARGFRKATEKYLVQSVPDSQFRARVTPHYAPGCKRLLISNEWYPALQRPNVELVTAPIEAIVPTGIVTADGETRACDTIILATGFRATEFIAPMKVVGRDGADLATTWSNGAKTHLGITVSGFPNFFLLVGPNTGLGHNSIVFMIESQLHYIIQAIQSLDARSASAIDLKPERQQTSYNRVQRKLRDTVWQSGCTSWYLDADGRNDTIWPGFTIEYWWRTRRFRLSDYRLLP